MADFVKDLGAMPNPAEKSRDLILPVSAPTLGASDQEFYVLGISLDSATQHSIASVFPRAVFYRATTENRGITPWLCEQLGTVVIFNHMQRIPPHMKVHVSAVFSLSDVHIIGIHPSPIDTVYDHAFEIGYLGVLHDQTEAHIIRKAALAVRSGELWFPRSYLSKRIQARSDISNRISLSERELELLSLLADGATNQELAKRLNVSRDTVRWHLRSIYGKLGVSERSAALQFARNYFSAKIIRTLGDS